MARLFEKKRSDGLTLCENNDLQADIDKLAAGLTDRGFWQENGTYAVSLILVALGYGLPALGALIKLDEEVITSLALTGALFLGVGIFILIACVYSEMARLIYDFTLRAYRKNKGYETERMGFQALEKSLRGCKSFAIIEAIGKDGSLQGCRRSNYTEAIAAPGSYKTLRWACDSIGEVFPTNGLNAERIQRVPENQDSDLDFATCLTAALDEASRLKPKRFSIGLTNKRNVGNQDDERSSKQAKAEQSPAERNEPFNPPKGQCASRREPESTEIRKAFDKYPCLVFSTYGESAQMLACYLARRGFRAYDLGGVVDARETFSRACMRIRICSKYDPLFEQVTEDDIKRWG